MICTYQLQDYQEYNARKWKKKKKKKSFEVFPMKRGHLEMKFILQYLIAGACLGLDCSQLQGQQ